MQRFSKTKQFAAFAVLALVIVVAVALGYRSVGSHPFVSSLDVMTRSSPAPLASGIAAVRPVSSTAAQLSSLDFEQSWGKFRDQFGEKLDGSFTADHRLNRIRATEGSSIPVQDYKKGSKEAALKRASEIIHEAEPLLRSNSASTLVARGIQADEISSQVEWVQTYKNVPIEPFGRVTVQLDQEGGLRGLYSNYISDPLITNEPTQDPVALKNSLLSQIHFTPDHPDQISAGILVLFAPGPQVSSSAVPMSYAYRYSVDGREVYVDASSGKVLSEKDRRQF